MARDRDRDRDRDDDRYDDEPDATPRRVDGTAARGRVALPAIFLMLFGTLGFLLGLVSLGVAVAAPEAFGNAYADLMKPLIEGQPPSPARDDQLAQVELVRKTRLDSPLNLALTALGTAVSGLIAVGGLRMKGLNSWGLAVLASVATFYPCASCLCFAAPFGLWSLVVLMNADVKAAFAAGKLPLTPDGD